MAYKILLAESTELLDKAFKLRHQVFVDEEKLLSPTADRRFVDRFDAYPTTHNLVVTKGEMVVGSMRLALDSSEGLPADEYYDFRQYMPVDSNLMHAGLFCVARKYRSSSLTRGMILMAVYFAVSNNVTHIVAPINPKLSNLLERIGFRGFGQEFVEPATGALMRPFILDLNDLNDFFLNFINKNSLRDFLKDYQRWFYEEGEVVIEANTVGNEAYLIIEGKACAVLPATSCVVGTLGPGDIVGELALLTDEVRSANVIALTKLQVMVLSKEVFRARFNMQSRDVLNLLQMLGKRTQSLIHKLENLQMHCEPKY